MTDPARSDAASTAALHPLQRIAQTAMAACLGVMALAVFVNVVMRYGFQSGFAASEELARLLFVWMVFIGATAAYPMGEHMAFTSLVAMLRNQPMALAAATALIRVLVILACGLVAWGAWLQVEVGATGKSVVMAYPNWLLPLPALLCASAIAVMALWELVMRKPLALEPVAEVE
jgi:TRAP-type transport system small permease protein